MRKTQAAAIEPRARTGRGVSASATRKAQAAVEYLITHGWAVLLLLTVIVVLYGLGIFNPNQYIPEECSFQPGFGCMNFRLFRGRPASGVGGSPAAALFINFSNGLGFDMSMVEMNVTTVDLGKGGPNTCVIAISGTSGTFTSADGRCSVQALASADGYMISNGASRGYYIFFNTQEAVPSIGSTHRVRLLITYTNPALSSRHFISGKIVARTERGL